MLQPGIRDRVEAYLSGSLSQSENTTQAEAAPAMDQYLGRESSEAATTQGDQQQSEPWRPSRPADFNKWCRVWQLIKRQVDQGKNIQEIAAWLEKTHPTTHPRSERQLGILRRAGEYGLLERTVETS